MTEARPSRTPKEESGDELVHFSRIVRELGWTAYKVWLALAELKVAALHLGGVAAGLASASRKVSPGTRRTGARD